MATVITDECINCGACEPECPNTAIYQGGVDYDGLDGTKQQTLSNEFFYIVPEKCTECVGFFDAEACAAVCPVDCCVPDPQRPETQEALFLRAKEIHPSENFPEDYPSRFKATSAESDDGAGSDDATTPAAPPAAPPAAGSILVGPEQALLASVPALDDWGVPLSCFRCSGKFEVPFQFIKPGTVLHCPHCNGSFVPNTSMYQNIARRVVSFYDEWTEDLETIRKRHQAKLDQFEGNLRARFERLRGDIDNLSDDAQLAGAPQRNRGFFG